MHVPGGDHDGEERDDGEERETEHAAAVGRRDDGGVGGRVGRRNSCVFEVERGFGKKGVEFVGFVSRRFLLRSGSVNGR